MPYPIAQTELDALGASLAQYYETAWEEGVKGLLADMGRAKMGIATGYLDQAKDTYVNLKKKSNDKFGVTFKGKLKLYMGVYLANKSDVASVLVTVAEKALNKLGSAIPIPGLATVVSGAVSLAADKGREELHTRSISEADQTLAQKTGPAPTKLFTTDTEAAAFIPKSIDQYKLICKYIQTLPASITTFEDAVTFPAAVFQVQAAASHLNVALVSVQQYLAGMQERLEKVQGVAKEYKDDVRHKMPEAVNSVLQTAYQDAYNRGKQDYLGKKYQQVSRPVLQKPSETGGATQLAAYVAHATALGYYEGGPEVELTSFPGTRVSPPPIRPRPGSVTPPAPIPPRPAIVTPPRGQGIETPLGIFPRRK
jgi:hypothetical protein